MFEFWSHSIALIVVGLPYKTIWLPSPSWLGLSRLCFKFTHKLHVGGIFGVAARVRANIRAYHQSEGSDRSSHGSILRSSRARLLRYG